MIELLTTIAGLVIPGAGIWGVAIKIATKLGMGWVVSAATGPIGSIIAKLSEGLVDVGVWLVKGVLGWLGEQLVDVFRIVSKDLRLAAVIWAAAWAGHAYGIGNAPAVPAPPPAKSAPAKTHTAPGTSQPTGLPWPLNQIIR